MDYFRPADVDVAVAVAVAVAGVAAAAAAAAATTTNMMFDYYPKEPERGSGSRAECWKCRYQYHVY